MLKEIIKTKMKLPNMSITVFICMFVIVSCCTIHISNAQKPGKVPASKFGKKAKVGQLKDESYIVPTSQMIDPAGTVITFPGRPMDIALNPDETILAVKNLKDIVFIDLQSNSIQQQLTLPQAGNSFTGLVWDKAGERIWTTDTKGYLRAAEILPDGKFAWSEALSLPSKFLPGGEYPSANEILEKSLVPEKDAQYPGGFAIDESRGLIYVTLNLSNSLGIIESKTRKFVKNVSVGVAPYTVIINGNKAYVTNWGGRIPGVNDKTALSAGTAVAVDAKTGIASSGTVSVIDLNSQKVIKEINVHLHPCAMALHPDGSRLYIANANSDLVSVIDTKTDELIKDINSKPMADLPFGSAPDALTVSPDGNTLYVANGGNNLVAVIDLGTNKIKALIPTGWYPGAIVLSKDGSKLFVANTKGAGGRYLDPGKKGYKTNGYLGSVSIIPVTPKSVLDKYTLRASATMRLPGLLKLTKAGDEKEKVVPVPTKPGEISVFKHVLYIIKENKTYDQVFGDLKQGNSDSSFCQFGRNVTPNHHKLAENFVLLDNTYCNGVLSADGHQWTDEGYATDYLEKSFGGFIRSYPYRGDDPLAFASSGFIWDKVLEKGLSFRNYGEFVDVDITIPKKISWSQMYGEYTNNTNNVTVKAKTRLHTLEPYNCPTFPGFTGNIPDVYRAREFLKELKTFEAKGELPNFMIMLLPSDHTVGTTQNYPTPSAAVADNDFALGQIIEAVSKSRFWKETAIFVIQDDPQSGLDHVDGKRTVALCVSPYTKRGKVISTRYNQNSILRTIELIFGLSPMSQFDLFAEPMVDCFTDKPDLSPYEALPNNVPLDRMNPKLSSLRGKPLYWAKKSMEMSFEEADRADEDDLNRIIWFSVKGYDVPYPKVYHK